MNITFSGVRPARREEVEEATRLAILKSSQLITVRNAAERWRNGSAISAALLAAGSLLGSGELIFGTTVGNRIAIGVLLGVATILTLVSLAMSMRASIGWPTKLAIVSTNALSEWEQKETSKTIRLLRWSMYLGMTAVVLLCIAVGLLYFGPHVPADPINLQLLLRNYK